MTEYRFSFDGEPSAREVTCPRCGEKHEGTTGFVLNEGLAYSTYYADWYPHDDVAWVEVTLGSFHEPDYADNVTMGCRYGYVDGNPNPAASLFTPTRAGKIFGSILDRAKALESPRLTDFWALTDWLVINDPLLKSTVYVMPSRPVDPAPTT